MKMRLTSKETYFYRSVMRKQCMSSEIPLKENEIKKALCIYIIRKILFKFLGPIMRDSEI